MNIKESYRKYRWFFTTSGKLVVGGKNAEQNEYLLQELKKSNEDRIVMHTASPGSPFSIIVDEIKKVTKKDKEECAVFTACFSQAWKKGKKTEVHIFRLSQLDKNSRMKIGTWEVFGKIDKINAELKFVLIKQKDVLRAVPAITAKNKETFGTILPGKENKESLISDILRLLNFKVNKEDILSALPAGGIKIKRI